MWVLLFVLSHHSVPPVETRFAPTIMAQEFSSLARCEAAKAFVLGTFGDLPEKMNEALQRQFASGYLHAPQQVILKARCLRK